MEKSFQLIRTNPKLTTNLKVVINSDYNIYLESFDSCKELSDDKYKHKLLNREAIIEKEIPKFYDGIPKNLAFLPKSLNDSDIMYKTYDNQFDATYFTGSKSIQDQWYKEEFEYFAPLYIKKNKLPESFIILRVDEPCIYELYNNDYRIGKLTKENFRNEIIDKWKSVKTFDLTSKTTIGTFFDNNINNNDRFPKFSLFFDNKKYNYSKWNGINYDTGVYTTKELMIDDLIKMENLHFNLEESLIDGFKNNGIIYPFILNLNFLFDDEPGTPDKLNKYSVNRYYGFYAEKFEHINTITTYNLDALRTDITVKNNIFIDNNSNNINPFLDQNKKSGWVQYDKEIYEIKEVSSGIFKIISDINFTNIPITDFNKNYCSIDYQNNKNYIISNSFNIDKYKDKDGNIDYMYADLYLIEIDGIYHVLKSDKILSGNTYQHTYYIQSDYAITSDNNLLKYWKGGVNNATVKNIIYNEIPLNYSKSLTKVSVNSEPLQYKIYRVKFTDIKDFDFDRIKTGYSDFDYEKTNYYVTIEDKLYTKEYRDQSRPMRTKVHDKSKNGQYKIMNISSEYSAGDELFEIVDISGQKTSEINSIWSKNQTVCKWQYDGSISHSDYSYKLNNCDKVGGKYNKTTNTDSFISDISEKNLDYFYRIGEFYGKKDSYIVNESDWTITILNNTGDTYIDLDVDKYYYISIDVKVTDISNLNDYYCGIHVDNFYGGYAKPDLNVPLTIEFVGKCKSSQLILSSPYCLTEFNNLKVKEIENKYYFNQSTNIQTGLITDDGKFNIKLYTDCDFDYFDYFFKNEMYFNDNGFLFKKPYHKYATFNGGDDYLYASTVFKGIEYKIYENQDIVRQRSNNIDDIKNIIDKGGEKFNDYKLSVILNDNYTYYEFYKTNSGYLSGATNPIQSNINYTLNDPDSLIDKTKNGIHVIVNEKYKNVLIIININIPININLLSLNNVTLLGENHALYYAKTLNNEDILPNDQLNIETYEPDYLTASYFIQSLNDLNSKGIYDEYVTYYYIKDKGQSGKTIITDLENSTMNTIPGWNKKTPPFHLELDTPDEMEIKNNSFNITSVKGPMYNIYDKYMAYTEYNTPIAETIIDEPLSRKISINEKYDIVRDVKHGENLKFRNSKPIKRFNGYYEPIFKNIQLFKPTYYWYLNDQYSSMESNYKFNLDFDNFAKIDELMYSKVNEQDNVLKLKNTTVDKSIYPMVDEIGLSVTDRNIFLSSWDSDFYIRTLDEHTLYKDYEEIQKYRPTFFDSLRIDDIQIIVDDDNDDDYEQYGEFNENSSLYCRESVKPYSGVGFEILITNTSTVPKHIILSGLTYKSDYAEIPIDLTGQIVDSGSLLPQRSYLFIINDIPRPSSGTSEISTNYSLVITTTLDPVPVDDDPVVDVNEDFKFKIINDIIEYEITGTTIINNTEFPELYELEKYNFQLTFTDNKNYVSSNYLSKMYVKDMNDNYLQIGNDLTGTKITGETKTVLFENYEMPYFEINEDDDNIDTELKFEVRHVYDVFDLPDHEESDMINSGFTSVKLYEYSPIRTIVAYNISPTEMTIGGKILYEKDINGFNIKDTIASYGVRYRLKNDPNDEWKTVSYPVNRNSLSDPLGLETRRDSGVAQTNLIKDTISIDLINQLFGNIKIDGLQKVTEYEFHSFITCVYTLDGVQQSKIYNGILRDATTSQPFNLTFTINSTDGLNPNETELFYLIGNVQVKRTSNNTIFKETTLDNVINYTYGWDDFSKDESYYIDFGNVSINGGLITSITIQRYSIFSGVTTTGDTSGIINSGLDETGSLIVNLYIGVMDYSPKIIETIDPYDAELDSFVTGGKVLVKMENITRYGIYYRATSGNTDSGETTYSIIDRSVEMDTPVSLSESKTKAPVSYKQDTRTSISRGFNSSLFSKILVEDLPMDTEYECYAFVVTEVKQYSRSEQGGTTTTTNEFVYFGEREVINTLKLISVSVKIIPTDDDLFGDDYFEFEHLLLKGNVQLIRGQEQNTPFRKRLGGGVIIKDIPVEGEEFNVIWYDVKSDKHKLDISNVTITLPNSDVERSWRINGGSWVGPSGQTIYFDGDDAIDDNINIEVKIEIDDYDEPLKTLRSPWYKNDDSSIIVGGSLIKLVKNIKQYGIAYKLYTDINFNKLIFDGFDSEHFSEIKISNLLSDRKYDYYAFIIGQEISDSIDSTKEISTTPNSNISKSSPSKLPSKGFSGLKANKDMEVEINAIYSGTTSDDIFYISPRLQTKTYRYINTTFQIIIDTGSTSGYDFAPTDFTVSGYVKLIQGEISGATFINTKVISVSNINQETNKYFFTFTDVLNADFQLDFNGLKINNPYVTLNYAWGYIDTTNTEWTYYGTSGSGKNTGTIPGGGDIYIYFMFEITNYNPQILAIPAFDITKYSFRTGCKLLDDLGQVVRSGIAYRNVLPSPAALPSLTDPLYPFIFKHFESVENTDFTNILIDELSGNTRYQFYSFVNAKKYSNPSNANTRQMDANQKNEPIDIYHISLPISAVTADYMTVIINIIADGPTDDGINKWSKRLDMYGTVKLIDAIKDEVVGEFEVDTYAYDYTFKMILKRNHYVDFSNVSVNHSYLSAVTYHYQVNTTPVTPTHGSIATNGQTINFSNTTNYVYLKVQAGIENSLDTIEAVNPNPDNFTTGAIITKNINNIVRYGIVYHNISDPNNRPKTLMIQTSRQLSDSEIDKKRSEIKSDTITRQDKKIEKGSGEFRAEDFEELKLTNLATGSTYKYYAFAVSRTNDNIEEYHLGDVESTNTLTGVTITLEIEFDYNSGDFGDLDKNRLSSYLTGYVKLIKRYKRVDGPNNHGQIDDVINANDLPNNKPIDFYKTPYPVVWTGTTTSDDILIEKSYQEEAYSNSYKKTWVVPKDSDYNSGTNINKTYNIDVAGMLIMDNFVTYDYTLKWFNDPALNSNGGFTNTWNTSNNYIPMGINSPQFNAQMNRTIKLTIIMGEYIYQPIERQK